MWWYPKQWAGSNFSMRADKINEMAQTVVSSASRIRYQNMKTNGFNTRTDYAADYAVKIYRKRQPVNHFNFRTNARGEDEVDYNLTDSYRFANQAVAWENVSGMDTGVLQLTGRTMRIIAGAQIDAGELTTTPNYYSRLAGVELGLEVNGQIYGESQPGTEDINSDKKGYSTYEDVWKLEVQIVVPINPGPYRIRMKARKPIIPSLFPTGSNLFYELNNRYIYVFDCK